MLGGLAIVRLHNVWTGGWEVIVTIFGWLATIGGLVRILWPRQMSDLAAGAAGTSFPITVFALLPLVLGAYLTWQGWRHCLDQR